MEDPKVDNSMIERRAETIDRKSAPIIRTPDSVSYLGVRLERATNTTGLYVPKPEQYADYINDDFTLTLQKDLAVSFHQGDPHLTEAGTSIGKTTTVRKMAADLGWEVHYANLNGATDVEDLMGRYVPNPNRHSSTDPEYVFADGKVTSGLRQEEGKTKIIILDEFNSANPNIVIRLHEVLDALDRNGDVVLSEDASEIVPVDKKKTKIVALMNPPGKGFFGREPLDPAQLRRWVYKKGPTNLPETAFSHATDALFTLAPQTQNIDQAQYLLSRDVNLLPEQLREIPGIHQVLAKYKEFHKSAKELVKERRIGTDQPQPFTYDDRMEPRRVRDFVLAFYNGDINETFQTALRYYYSNKLESETDKAALDQLIGTVAYQERIISQRRGLDRLNNPLIELINHEEIRLPLSPEVGGVMEHTDLMRSERDAWQETLGATVEVKPLPEYVTPEVRRNLERLGMELRYIPALELGSKDDIKPITRPTPGLFRRGSEEVAGAEEAYIKGLESKYPLWHHYESMSAGDKEKHKIPRNLNQWFWEQVKDGKIDFPKLPGQWVAVETIPKPAYRTKYEKTALSDELGLEDRFSVSWNDAKAAIDSKKGKLRSDIGLIGVDIRMLEAVEWNLLANREEWGATNTYEWTNTEFRDGSVSRRVIAGLSAGGGAAYAGWHWPGHRNDHLGFRVAVILDS